MKRALLLLTLALPLAVGCQDTRLTRLPEERATVALEAKLEKALILENRRLEALAEQKVLRRRYAENVKALHAKYRIP